MEPAVETLRFELAPLVTVPCTRMFWLVAEAMDTEDADRVFCVTFPRIHDAPPLTKEMAPPAELFWVAVKVLTALIPELRSMLLSAETERVPAVSRAPALSMTEPPFAVNVTLPPVNTPLLVSAMVSEPPFTVRSTFCPVLDTPAM